MTKLNIVTDFTLLDSTLSPTLHSDNRHITGFVMHGDETIEGYVSDARKRLHHNAHHALHTVTGRSRCRLRILTTSSVPGGLPRSRLRRCRTMQAPLCSCGRDRWSRALGCSLSPRPTGSSTTSGRASAAPRSLRRYAAARAPPHTIVGPFVDTSLRVRMPQTFCQQLLTQARFPASPCNSTGERPAAHAGG